MHKGRVVFRRHGRCGLGRPAPRRPSEQMTRPGRHRAPSLLSAQPQTADRRGRRKPQSSRPRYPDFERNAAHTPRGPSLPPPGMPCGRSDLIVTVGGGSITDCAKLYSSSRQRHKQRRLQSTDRERRKASHTRVNDRARRCCRLACRRRLPRRVHTPSGVTNNAQQVKEAGAPSIGGPARVDPRSRYHRSHAGIVFCHRHPRRRPLAVEGRCFARGASLRRRPRR